MKLYTLGTSHGAAEKGRSCSVNLLEVGDAYYLFDCGGCVEERMTDLDLPMQNIKGVFISHMHSDHVTNLPSVIKRLVRYNKSKNEELTQKIFMPEQRGIDAINIWMQAMHRNEDASRFYSLKLTKPGVIYSDENITVTAIETHHVENGKYPSYAHMIEAEGKRFFYTGDLAYDFHDYPTILSEKEFDAVLCELVHFDIDANFDTLKNTKTKHLIFTHGYPKKIAQMEPRLSEFPFPVTITNECDVYEI